MPRYFLELSYKGGAYSGFQVQANANSVQAEVEKACSVFLRKPVALTGSSRTDAGVHALQNFFHFDLDLPVPTELIYRVNAILPPDISLLSLKETIPDAHCRFNALSRSYRYRLYPSKNPFLSDRAYYYPFPLDRGLLDLAAKRILGYTDFDAFSKRNTQVKNFRCRIDESRWSEDGEGLHYCIRANRFLRGMVRGITGTMLLIGRKKLTLETLDEIVQSKDVSRVNFNVPAKGLFLEKVEYPSSLFLS